MITLPLDAHLHTDLSPDADVPIDRYGALAVEQGIAELAITDHLDFDPRRPAYGIDYGRRLRLVREAAERWAGRVAIRLGVEITYQRRYEEAIRDHLRRHRYDFVIGSVHVDPDAPYHRSRVAGWVAGRPLAEVVAPYFDEVLAAIRSGLFDVIGHLDFVKRYLIPHVTPDQLASAPELYEPLLRALVESGMGLEVNTSGLRQAPGETYPAAWVVRRYRELGGRAVTVGSDAHRVDHFAVGLPQGYRIVAGAGLNQLTFRRGAERVTIPLPEAVGVPGATGGP
jgi:histidinol-phosphatase (PHP family)